MAKFAVACRIDGHPYALVLDADDAPAAAALLDQQWRAEQTCEYRTAKGNQVLVQWANVAALEIGPATAL